MYVCQGISTSEHNSDTIEAELASAGVLTPIPVGLTAEHPRPSSEPSGIAQRGHKVGRPWAETYEIFERRQANEASYCAGSGR